MIKKCLVCGKQFERRGISAINAKFCSFKCKGIYSRGKKLSCKDPESRSKKQSFNMLNRKNPMCNSEIKAKRDKKLKEYYKTHTVWNKGLTKKTNESIKDMSQKMIGSHLTDKAKLKISLFNKKRFSNPLERERQSLRTSLYFERNPEERLKRAKQNHNGYGKSGYFYSEKNKKLIFYRSSYELIAMQIFEQQSKIIRYEHEVLSISYIAKDGSNHITIPDFLVYYDDGAKEIIEVKPKYKIEKDVDNTNIKIEAMGQYAKKNDYIFNIWTEDILKKQ